MQELTQNWTWILIAIAVAAFFLLRRVNRHGGFGQSGHGHGGFDLGGNHGHHHHRHSNDADRRDVPWPQQPPETVVDPVSGAAIRTADAITSVYQGRAYYFASKENRDRFEASPQNYANKVQGIPIGGEDGAGRARRRHRGC